MLERWVRPLILCELSQDHFLVPSLIRIILTSSASHEAVNGQIRRLLKITCGLRDQEYRFHRIRDLVD